MIRLLNLPESVYTQDFDSDGWQHAHDPSLADSDEDCCSEPDIGGSYAMQISLDERDNLSVPSIDEASPLTASHMLLQVQPSTPITKPMASPSNETRLPLQSILAPCCEARSKLAANTGVSPHKASISASVHADGPTDNTFIPEGPATTIDAAQPCADESPSLCLMPTPAGQSDYESVNDITTPETHTGAMAHCQVCNACDACLEQTHADALDVKTPGHSELVTWAACTPFSSPKQQHLNHLQPLLCHCKFDSLSHRPNQQQACYELDAAGATPAIFIESLADAFAQLVPYVAWLMARSMLYGNHVRPISSPIHASLFHQFDPGGGITCQTIKHVTDDNIPMICST